MIPRVLSLTLGTVAAFLLLSGGSRELPSLARTCLALLLLLPVLVYWGWPRHTGAPAACSRQPAGWLDWLSLGAVVAVIGSGFVWLLHAIPQPLESLSLGLEARLRPQAASTRREARQRQSQPQQGNWLWNDQSRRPLPKRTHFKPSNRPEIFLRLRDPGDAVELLQGQLYVRAFTLTRYHNASWSAHPGTPEILRADATGLVQLATPTRRTIVHEIFQSYDPAGQNVLTALQGVAAAQVPVVTRLDEGLFILPPALKPSGYEYVASSAPLRLEDLPETPDIPVRPNLPPVFTQGTESPALAARIRDLAYIAAGTGTTQQRLRNLRNHLRSTLNYSLACDNPADLDPIENFLFAEQRGHCEYFATAGALLARSLGIPARVAYGWAGGTYYESSSMFVFRAREAHAWTEVCLDGQGWVVLDPTPPGGIQSNRAAVARPDENPPAAEAPGDSADDPLATISPARLAWWLTLGLALPALALLGWRGLTRKRALEGAPDARQPTAGTPHYLSAWRRAAAGRGMPMPAGMTLRRHLRGLAHPAPFATGLLDYHYAVRYCGVSPDRRREQRLVRAIRKWGDGSHHPG